MNRTFFRFVSLSAVGMGLLAGTARADLSVPIGDLAPGETIRLSYEVAIEEALPTSATQISQQVTVAFDGGTALSDDPETAVVGDPTITPLADVLAPRVVSILRSSPAVSPATADTLVFRVAFDEAVQGIDAGDFGVTGTTATVTTATDVGGNAYDLTVTGGDLAGLTGTVTLGFSGGQDIRDLSDNALVDLTPTGANDNFFEVANNDAPVLTPFDPVLPGMLSTDTDTAGLTVASIVGTSITDADPGAEQGIALLLAGSSHGQWQFSVDGGASWTTFAISMADGDVLLLRAVDRIRFVPDGLRGDSPVLGYVAWDQTGATAGLEGTRYVPPAAAGGSTPFSAVPDAAHLTVTPSVIGTYEDWLIANFTEAERSDGTIVGLDQDPDGAGVVNLLRFALDLPAHGSVPPPTMWTTVDEAGITYPALHFNVRRLAPGLSYVVESSVDLVQWTLVSTWYPNSAGTVTARDAVALSDGPRRFLRLRVERVTQ